MWKKNLQNSKLWNGYFPPWKCWFLHQILSNNLYLAHLIAKITSPPSNWLKVLAFPLKNWRRKFKRGREESSRKWKKKRERKCGGNGFSLILLHMACLYLYYLTNLQKAFKFCMPFHISPFSNILANVQIAIKIF